MRPQGLSILISSTLLFGCAASVNKTATISGSDQKLDYSYTLIDERKEDKRGSFLTEQGNIYSCQYGIFPIAEKQLVPDRLTYLGNYLEINARQQVRGKKVEVKRFAIYQNKQGSLKKSLSTVSVGQGLVVDVVRDIATTPGPVIGCAGTNTGEYHANELSQGGSPLVIYLNVSIASKMYRIRTVYPMLEPTNDNAQWSKFVKGGIDVALGKMASEIKHPPRRRRFRK